MKIFKLTNKQSGFSLIEIMVAVAIISVLALIAIPNYNFFKRRAMQTEVKTTLSNIYSAQIVFITEWGYGTANLRQMGYDQVGEAYYNAGWRVQDKRGIGVNVNSTTRTVGYRGPLAVDDRHTSLSRIGLTFAYGAKTRIDGRPGTSLDAQGTCSCTTTPCPSGVVCSLQTGGNFCSNTGTGGTGHCGYEAGGVNNSSLPEVTFLIGASGNIGGTQADKWTLTQDKELTNTQDGTK